jgi:adenosine deaminase
MVRRLVVLLCLAVSAFADEDSTAERFEKLRNDPLLLRRFLEQMPKGGDLHQHLSGSVYAESFVTLAAKDNLCIDTDSLAYESCDSEGPHVPASQALSDPALYSKMLDALSMRQFRPGTESGHDRFFATFGRFSAVSKS